MSRHAASRAKFCRNNKNKQHNKINMDVIPKNIILKHNSDTLVAVREANGFCDGEQIKEMVDALEKWIKEQKHFTKKDFSKHYLETTIISSKGSLDRAKGRFEKACFYKTTLPQFFGSFDIRNDFKEFDGVFTQAVLPKLTRDNDRVYLIRNAGQKFQSSLILQFTRIAIMFIEYLKEYDYSDGVVVVVDLRDVSLFEVTKKITLNDFRQSAAIIIEAYGTRMKGLHLISSSRIIAVLMWFVKQVLSTKLASRVHAHSTPETLHKFVPKEIFPKEYDGEERSFQSLHEEWREIFSSAETRRFMEEVSNAKIDDSREKSDLTKQSVDIRNLNFD